MTHIPLNMFVEAQSVHIEAGLMFALFVPDAKVGRAGGCVYLGRTASVGGAQGHSAGSLCVTDNERPRVWPVTVEVQVQTRLNLSGSCV